MISLSLLSNQMTATSSPGLKGDEKFLRDLNLENVKNDQSQPACVWRRVVQLEERLRRTHEMIISN